MWIELSTTEECVDCKPPYSFYFDIVRRLWRAPTSNPLPLHRICTLARKQSAAYVVVESALTLTDVREEIVSLDDFLGGSGEAEAVAIAFFADGPSPTDIENVADQNLLGQVILINYRAAGSADFTHSYIYDAVFSPPMLVSADGVRKGLLNNYIFAEGGFKRTVNGREFNIRGIYYCQQNRHTQVCAHACLRMALNSIDVCNPPISGQTINNFLGIQPPFAGLQLGHIRDVIENTTGVRPWISDCSGLTAPQYLSISSR